MTVINENGYVIAACALVVIMAIAVSVISMWGAWLIFGRATQAARYDLDATQQTMKFSEILDRMVRARISVMRFMVDKEGNLIDSEGQTATTTGDGTGKQYKFRQQPVDPNVKFSQIVDDVHEAERESNRIIGDAEYSKRDDFAGHTGSMANTQPPAMEV